MAIDYTTARKYLDSGLCVLPAIKAQKRPNLNSWEYYKTQLPTNKDLALWFGDNSSGICIVCGAVSGNLEIIDFDEKGLAFGPWGDRVKNDELIPGLYDKLVVEQSPSGGFHVIYRCELPVSGNQKLAKTEDSKTLIETRGEGGLFLCAPTEGYELKQGDFTSIPTISAVERNILLQHAKHFHIEKKNASYNNSFGLPISEPIDGTTIKRKDVVLDAAEGRPGDVFNQTGDIRALLIKHGWTRAGINGDEERWTRPGKKSGTSATLRNIDGKDYFYVFSSNAAPLESERSYDAFGLFASLECSGDVKRASEELLRLGFGEKIRPHRDLPEIDFSQLQVKGVSVHLAPVPTAAAKKPTAAFQNRRDPENFEDFPLGCLPPRTKRYVEEKAKSLHQNPAGLAMALLTQCGAHIGASVKLRLGADWFTTGTLWYVFVGLSGNGKSPAINSIAALADDIKDQFHREYAIKQKEYLPAMKVYEKAKKKGEDVTPPTAPEWNRIIVTDATYEGLIKAVKESGGRILLKLDEMISLFAMTNRTKTAGEAQKWLSGYSGESVTTVRSLSLETHIKDAYWSISGGSTPEKLREFISAEGRDKDGTLSRFVMVWPPEETEYGEENDIDPSSVLEMKRVIEKLIQFQPPEGKRNQVVTFDDDTKKSWGEWKKAIFYAKQNSNTDVEVSFISKSQDLLPRIATILHCLFAAEEALDAEENLTKRRVETVDGVTYSDPIELQMSIPPVMEIETWRAALDITQWLRQETLSCYRQLMLIASATPDESTNKLISVIQDAGADGVTLRDIGQKIKRFRGVEGQKALFPILDSLIADGKIKRKTEKSNNNHTTDKYYYGK